MPAKLIGFAGRSGSGKTECAKFLEQVGFVRDAYARPLKQACSAAFGLPLSCFYGTPEERAKVDPYWNLSYREIMQKFGTEAMRGTFGSQFWVQSFWARYTDPWMKGKNLVIEDVRFVSEAEDVLSRGGIVVEVLRPSAEPKPIPFWQFWKKEHESERPLPDEYVTYRIMNDETIGQLQRAVLRILEVLNEKQA